MELVLPKAVIQKYTLKRMKSSNKKNTVLCYVDEEGVVYKIEDDEEVGSIIGEQKNGIFFQV